jgi:patatin-related protein
MDEELRIAVVMNGGVSLAVWIGGVTLETGRVVAGESAYGEIQALTGTTTRVDVICGTSAGGVNGAFLAMAMAYHRQDLGSALALLRSLWVTKGSIGELLRDPFMEGSRSLLDGDGYFLESLRQAFRTLQTGTATNPDEVPIDLVISTTLLRGLERDYADDFGSRIRDVSHRAQFDFRRGSGLKHDAFAAPYIAHQLALAARSTASFPAAFEPSFCPVNDTTDLPFRPDMKGIASFPVSRFVIDGGVLDNSPIDLALDRIYHQRARGPVRRVLAYVVPDPGTTARKRDGDATKPDDIDELPELLDVGVASLVQIPAVQSISAQLQQLRDHNDQVRNRRRARVLLTQYNAALAIDQLSDTLFAAYRASRIANAIDYIVLEISKGLVLQGNYGLGRRGRRDWLQRAIANLAASLPWVPTASPLSGSASVEQSIAGWRWGTRPVEHLSRVLLDIVIRTERLTTLLSRPADLESVWNAAYDILENIERVRDSDRNYWRGQAGAVLGLLGDGKSNVEAPPRAGDWVAKAVSDWQASAYREAAELMYAIARQLLQLWPTVSTLTAAARQSADRFVGEQGNELWNLYAYFVREANDAQPTVVARLLAYETTQDALGGRGTIAEQELEFIEISARSRSTFGGPEEPAQKLAGIQLAHFGAFYKSSWRANDWMWGRIDAVHRLVRILLDPERLRIAARQFPAGQRATKTAAEIGRIALATKNPALAAELGRLLVPLADLAAELAYLDNDAIIVPENLPLAIEALSRRLEGEILSTELARVADAVEDDFAAGCFDSEQAKSFLSRCRKVTSESDRTVQADQLGDVLSICDIGSERLESEVGTDRLSTIATQAVAVAVSSMRTEAKLLAIVGKLLAVLRAPAILFYIFARNAQYRSRTGVAANAAAVAAGAVVIVTQIIAEKGPYNGSLLALAIAAIVLPVLWVALQWPGIARKFAAFLAIIVLALVAAVLLHIVTLPKFTTGIWQSIATACVGIVVILLAAGFWPTRRKSLSRVTRPSDSSAAVRSITPVKRK